MTANAMQTSENVANRAAAAHRPVRRSASKSRFTYASGARPLAGYTIKRGIGHGGFGEVYFATSDAGKEVALKLIRRNLDIELRGVTQCLNLKHPNLLSLYDVRQDNQGDTWVVMELMTGQSLEDLLARNPNGLPIDEALAWMHGIAAGVAYLHDHGIVHRDLKPGNIFVDEGIVKIGDYGLSKFISCSRRSGQTGSVGTVHYMAPEIANGRYGKEIDIYALGIILYEMLTGHVPFEGESVGEILMKHLTAEPDVSRVAEPYRTIVARALAKDPAKRLASVGELIALLPPAPTGTAAAFRRPQCRHGQRRRTFSAAAAPQPAANTGCSLREEVRRAGQQANAGEPIAGWFHDTWRDLSIWWERHNFQPWQKVAILCLGLFITFKVISELGLLSTSDHHTSREFWIFVAICYLVYRGWQRRHRDTASAANGSASKTPGPTVLAAAPVAEAQAKAAAALRESPTRRRWRFQTTAAYQLPPPRHRLMQLTSSLLLSAIICPILALVVLILRGQPLEPNQYAWLASTSVLGTWAVLIPAKFWEGANGDAARRRFVMLVMGLMFGAAAYGLSDWLMVSLPYDARLSMTTRWDVQHTFFAADGSPLWTAYLAYFGFLFAVPRWWRQANPVRDTRLSIWYTVVAVFWAWLPAVFFWPFPQPWGLMLAAITAIAVQLASPWVPKDQRQSTFVRPGEV